MLVTVLGDQLSPRNPLRRVLRVQVPGEPLDLGAELALEPRRALTRDAAEWSKEVRPD